MSGKLRLDIKPVDLSSVIENAVELLRPAAQGKGIDVQFTLNAAREVITGDADRLQQIDQTSSPMPSNSRPGRARRGGRLRG